MGKLKVLIICNSISGLYSFRKELLEELRVPGSYIEDRQAEPCEVFVSCPAGEHVDDLIKIGCKFIETPIQRHSVNPIADLKLYTNYRKMVKQVKPDIVFGYTIKPNIYGGMACAEKSIPFVCNITGLGTAVENKGILQIITLSLYKIALRNVQTVFFQNSANESFFTQHKLCLGKHKMLPGSGVNLQYYEPAEYPRTDKIEFAFIARIMKEKGIEEYLAAAKYIRQKYPDTRFHICGYCEQDYTETIKQLQESNVIIYHGEVSDMKKIYQQIHCTVHPTYYPEGLSNVLLESAASARPIITTNRPGCREVIDDGINGYLIEEKNSKDLIEKIEKFISLTWMEKKQLGLNGRKKVENQFDRKIVVKRYMEELPQGDKENEKK